MTTDPKATMTPSEFVDTLDHDALRDAGACLGNDTSRRGVALHAITAWGSSHPAVDPWPASEDDVEAVARAIASAIPEGSDLTREPAAWKDEARAAIATLTPHIEARLRTRMTSEAAKRTVVIHSGGEDGMIDQTLAALSRVVFGAPDAEARCACGGASTDDGHAAGCSARVTSPTPGTASVEVSDEDVKEAARLYNQAYYERDADHGWRAVVAWARRTAPTPTLDTVVPSTTMRTNDGKVTGACPLCESGTDKPHTLRDCLASHRELGQAEGPVGRAASRAPSREAIAVDREAVGRRAYIALGFVKAERRWHDLSGAMRSAWCDVGETIARDVAESAFAAVREHYVPHGADGLERTIAEARKALRVPGPVGHEGCVCARCAQTRTDLALATRRAEQAEAQVAKLTAEVAAAVAAHEETGRHAAGWEKQCRAAEAERDAATNANINNRVRLWRLVQRDGEGPNQVGFSQLLERVDALRAQPAVPEAVVALVAEVRDYSRRAGYPSQQTLAAAEAALAAPQPAAVDTDAVEVPAASGKEARDLLDMWQHGFHARSDESANYVERNKYDGTCCTFDAAEAADVRQHMVWLTEAVRQLQARDAGRGPR